MPPRDLDKLIRTRAYDRGDMIVLRPGIALVMYSQADLRVLMAATADVLEAYLNFVPRGAIAACYEPPEDEYLPDGFLLFDLDARRDLLERLRTGPPSQEDEGYGFELTSTTDGQAGEYGVSFGGINFDFDYDEDEADEDEEDEEERREEEEEETSLLRLELPWNFLDSVEVSRFVDFVERVANLFPFSSGNAGLSFNFTVGYTTAAGEEMQPLLPRFLGFDSTFNSPQLKMRGKSPPAHWLNLIDGDLVQALGGEPRLRRELSSCEVRGLNNGLLVRGAMFPPVVDVNRQGTDIGRLPDVARVLRPVRFASPSFAPVVDKDKAERWLARFDDRAVGEWDNR
jgi:hypothetical protein